MQYGCPQDALTTHHKGRESWGKVSLQSRLPSHREQKERAMKTQSILCLTAVLFATLTNGQLHSSSSKRSDEGANKKWLAKKKKDYTSFLKLFSRDLQRKWKQPCFVQKKTATKQTNSNTTRLCWRSYSFLLHFLLTARQRQQPALRYARATRSIKTRFL